MSEIPRINQSECCGCGLCTYALPEVFRMTPEQKSEAFAPEKAEKNDIQKVIDDCPCMAIHWHNQN
jgi:ferredoxin